MGETSYLLTESEIKILSSIRQRSVAEETRDSGLILKREI